MSNLKELYTQDWRGSWTATQQILTNHKWLDHLLQIIDETDVSILDTKLTELTVRVGNLENNFINSVDSLTGRLNAITTLANRLELEVDGITERVESIEDTLTHVVTSDEFEELVREIPTDIGIDQDEYVLMHDGNVIRGQEGGMAKVPGIVLEITRTTSEQTNGTIDGAFWNRLTATNLNLILMEGEYYSLADTQSEDLVRIYSHVGVNNGSQELKSITLNRNSMTWTLSVTQVGGDEGKEIEVIYDVEPSTTDYTYNLSAQNGEGIGSYNLFNIEFIEIFYQSPYTTFKAKFNEINVFALGGNLPTTTTITFLGEDDPLILQFKDSNNLSAGTIKNPLIDNLVNSLGVTEISIKFYIK